MAYLFVRIPSISTRVFAVIRSSIDINDVYRNNYGGSDLAAMLDRVFLSEAVPDLWNPSGSPYDLSMYDYRDLCLSELVAPDLRQGLHAFASHLNVTHFGRHHLIGDYTLAHRAEGLTICSWLQGGAPDVVLDAINVSKSHEPATLFWDSSLGVPYAR